MITVASSSTNLIENITESINGSSRNTLLDFTLFMPSFEFFQSLKFQNDNENKKYFQNLSNLISYSDVLFEFSVRNFGSLSSLFISDFLSTISILFVENSDKSSILFPLEKRRFSSNLELIKEKPNKLQSEEDNILDELEEKNLEPIEILSSEKIRELKQRQTIIYKNFLSEKVLKAFKKELSLVDEAQIDKKKAILDEIELHPKITKAILQSAGTIQKFGLVNYLYLRSEKCLKASSKSDFTIELIAEYITFIYKKFYGDLVFLDLITLVINFLKSKKISDDFWPVFKNIFFSLILENPSDASLIINNISFVYDQSLTWKEDFKRSFESSNNMNQALVSNEVTQELFKSHFFLQCIFDRVENKVENVAIEDFWAFINVIKSEVQANIEKMQNKDLEKILSFIFYFIEREKLFKNIVWNKYGEEIDNKIGEFEKSQRKKEEKDLKIMIKDIIDFAKSNLNLLNNKENCFYSVKLMLLRKTEIGKWYFNSFFETEYLESESSKKDFILKISKLESIYDSFNLLQDTDGRINVSLLKKNIDRTVKVFLVYSDSVDIVCNLVKDFDISNILYQIDAMDLVNITNKIFQHDLEQQKSLILEQEKKYTILDKLISQSKITHLLKQKIQKEIKNHKIQIEKILSKLEKPIENDVIKDSEINLLKKIEDFFNNQLEEIAIQVESLDIKKNPFPLESVESIRFYMNSVGKQISDEIQIDIHKIYKILTFFKKNYYDFYTNLINLDLTRYETETFGRKFSEFSNSIKFPNDLKQEFIKKYQENYLDYLYKGIPELDMRSLVKQIERFASTMQDKESSFFHPINDENRSSLAIHNLFFLYLILMLKEAEIEKLSKNPLSCYLKDKNTYIYFNIELVGEKNIVKWTMKESSIAPTEELTYLRLLEKLEPYKDQFKNRDGTFVVNGFSNHLVTKQRTNYLYKMLSYFDKKEILSHPECVNLLYWGMDIDEVRPNETKLEYLHTFFPSILEGPNTTIKKFKRQVLVKEVSLLSLENELLEIKINLDNYLHRLNLFNSQGWRFGKSARKRNRNEARQAYKILLSKYESFLKKVKESNYDSKCENLAKRGFEIIKTIFIPQRTICKPEIVNKHSLFKDKWISDSVIEILNKLDPLLDRAIISTMHNLMSMIFKETSLASDTVFGRFIDQNIAHVAIDYLSFIIKEASYLWPQIVKCFFNAVDLSVDISEEEMKTIRETFLQQESTRTSLMKGFFPNLQNQYSLDNNALLKKIRHYFLSMFALKYECKKIGNSNKYDLSGGDHPNVAKSILDMIFILRVSFIAKLREFNFDDAIQEKKNEFDQHQKNIIDYFDKAFPMFHIGRPNGQYEEVFIDSEKR